LIIRYYKSKDELILGACSSAFQEMRLLLVPVLTRQEPYPPSQFIREVTKVITSRAQQDKLNFGVAFLTGWGEAQFNPKLKEFVCGGQLLYRGALTAVVRNWQKRGEIRVQTKPVDVAKIYSRSFLVSSFSQQ
jgi:hypothetical protein